MTTLTGQLPESTYGDLLTVTNSGAGLINTLTNVQDGLGNNSPMQLSKIAVNFSRSGAQFQLDGSAVTSNVTSLNSMCALVPTLLNLTADPGSTPNGGIYYNSATNHIRVCINGVWTTLV